MAKAKPFVVKVPTTRTTVVAVRSIRDSEVVAHGTKPSAVAKKSGLDNPVLMHVPQPGKTYVY